MNFRSGQWVKFEGSFPGAAVSKDGKIVGIYCKEGTDPLGKAIPAKIVVVDSEGYNLMTAIGGAAIAIEVSPSQPGLVAVMDRKDIPAKRLQGNADWRPRP